MPAYSYGLYSSGGLPLADECQQVAVFKLDSKICCLAERAHPTVQLALLLWVCVSKTHRDRMGFHQHKLQPQGVRVRQPKGVRVGQPKGVRVRQPQALVPRHPRSRARNSASPAVPVTLVTYFLASAMLPARKHTWPTTPPFTICLLGSHVAMVRRQQPLKPFRIQPAFSLRKSCQI